LNDAEPWDRVDNQAIVGALKERLSEDGVTTVRLDGPVLDSHPLPEGFGRLASTLAGLAEAQGLRFHVGPL
jgi:hypothetical protein